LRLTRRRSGRRLVWSRQVGMEVEEDVRKKITDVGNVKNVGDVF
jgi:hypothetical protein